MLTPAEDASAGSWSLGRDDPVESFMDDFRLALDRGGMRVHGPPSEWVRCAREWLPLVEPVVEFVSGAIRAQLIVLAYEPASYAPANASTPPDDVRLSV